MSGFPCECIVSLISSARRARGKQDSCLFPDRETSERIHERPGTVPYAREPILLSYGRFVTDRSSLSRPSRLKSPLFFPFFLPVPSLSPLPLDTARQACFFAATARLRMHTALASD